MYIYILYTHTYIYIYARKSSHSMSGYMSGRMSVGGDHKKKEIIVLSFSPPARWSLDFIRVASASSFLLLARH